MPQNLYQPPHTSLSIPGRHRVQKRPANANGTRAQSQRLEHIRPSSDTTIDKHLELCFRLRSEQMRRVAPDLQKRQHRRLGGVLASPAVVREHDPIDTVLMRHESVLNRLDALDHNRQRRRLPDPFEISPCQPRVQQPRRRRLCDAAGFGQWLVTGRQPLIPLSLANDGRIHRHEDGLGTEALRLSDGSLRLFSVAVDV